VQIAVTIGTSERFGDVVDQIVELDRAGVDAVWLAENHGHDAPTRMAYLAAKTERIQIGSNVMAISTRTPSLMAMTAASLDFLSDGRFNLGIGIGGRELLEGWHGLTFDRPLGRMREYVEICRKAWARDAALVHEGRHYTVPLGADRGEGGLGQSILLEEPIRPHIPIWCAAIGEKSVTQAAEIADGWLPLFLIPEKVKDAWGDALASGLAKRDPALGPLQISLYGTLLAIGEGDEVLRIRELARPVLAAFLGGIGPNPWGPNHYRLLAERYGYEAQAKVIEGFWSQGKYDEAAAAVPGELLELTSLVGPRSWVAERLAAYEEAGVTQLQVCPVTDYESFKGAVTSGFNWQPTQHGTELVIELKEMAGS
jgi:F420-dependent oxidoreductase-like protein